MTRTVVEKKIETGKPRAGRALAVKSEVRYTVALTRSVASQVQRQAKTSETSMSKAIAMLVRLGLEGQQTRKKAFFQKLKVNLAEDDSAAQDRLVDEFRSLILGR